MSNPKFIAFCDGGCYTLPDRTTTPSYFSFQVWDSQHLQQFYNGNIKVKPRLSMERFYLKSLIMEPYQESTVFYDRLKNPYEVRPHEDLFLPGNCSIYDNLGKETNNIAEYAALYFTLRAIINELPFGEKIQLFSDSQLIIKQVTGYWRCNKPHLQKWLIETKILVDKLDLQLTHVTREIIERILNH